MEKDKDLANLQLGILSFKLQNYPAAIVAFEALLKSVKAPEFYSMLGISYASTNNPQKAINCVRECMLNFPDQKNIFLLFTTSNLLENKHCFDQLEELLLEGNKKHPNYAPIYYLLGELFHRKDNDEKSMEYFEQSLQLDPQLDYSHLAYSRVLLLNGKLLKGWKEYLWRWKSNNYHHKLTSIYSPQVDANSKYWDGKPYLDKTILLFDEQGFGDSIQFSRYIKFVKERFDKVIFQTKEPLLKLYSSLTEIDLLISRTEKIPPHDFFVSLLDLPFLFQTELITIPNQVPYLNVSENKADLKNYIDKKKNFKIGICWQGNPNHKQDANRSINHSWFKTLKEKLDISLFSLQKENRKYEYPDYIIDLNPYIEEFSDLAFIINQMDLVISVDTAPAHLAGALGKPVWVLIYKPTEWRWLKNIDTSPWYPTMRLFRQSKEQIWDDVFEKIETALKNT